jgi:hypothetical protein
MVTAALPKRQRERAFGFLAVAALGLGGNCGRSGGTAAPTAGSTPSVVGLQSAQPPIEAVDGAGGTLYVQRTTDIHASKPAGPIVGRLHAGTLVSVARSEDGSFRIDLPGFAQPTGERKEPVAFYADRAAFGTESKPLEVPELEGRRVVDFAPQAVLYTASDLAEPFVLSRCGDAYVSAEEDGHARVTQFYAGAEITGWFEFIPELPGPIHCASRTVRRKGALLELVDNVHLPARIDALPPDFVTNEGEGAGDTLVAPMRAGGTVYLLMPARAGARCEPWRFDSFRQVSRATASGAKTAVLKARLSQLRAIVDPAFTANASFDVRFDPSAHEVTLDGPSFRVRPSKGASPEAGPGDSRCSSVYGFVGATSEMIRLLPGGEPGPDLVAWSADDEERWYASATVCDQAKARSAAAANEHPSWPPGGVHRACHPALYR